MFLMISHSHALLEPRSGSIPKPWVGSENLFDEPTHGPIAMNSEPIYRFDRVPNTYSVACPQNSAMIQLNRLKLQKVILSAAILCLILFGTLVALFLHSVSGKTIDWALASKVVNRIRSGEIRIPNSTIIQLPPDLQGASCDGQIYATKLNGKLLIVFKTWTHNRHNAGGFLYSDPPITASDFLKDHPDGLDLIKIGQLEFAVEEQVKENWWKTEHSWD